PSNVMLMEYRRGRITQEYRRCGRPTRLVCLGARSHSVALLVKNPHIAHQRRKTHICSNHLDLNLSAGGSPSPANKTVCDVRGFSGKTDTARTAASWRAAGNAWTRVVLV